MSLFERVDMELGRFSIRPLDAEADAEIVHGWVTDPKAAFWPTPGTAVTDVVVEYRAIEESSWQDAFVGLHDGRPAFLIERYHPAHNEVGDTYEVQDGDVGMHFLVAPPTDQPIHGFTHAVITTVMEFLFADPAVSRVVVEPDVRNGAVQSLNAAVGFRIAMVVSLPDKEAMLSICTREDFEAARQVAEAPRMHAR